MLADGQEKFDSPNGSRERIFDAAIGNVETRVPNSKSIVGPPALRKEIFVSDDRPESPLKTKSRFFGGSLSSFSGRPRLAAKLNIFAERRVKRVGTENENHPGFGTRSFHGGGSGESWFVRRETV